MDPLDLKVDTPPTQEQAQLIIRTYRLLRAEQQEIMGKIQELMGERTEHT